MDVGGARDRVRLIIDREDTAYLSDADIDGFVEMAVDEFASQYYNNFEVNQESRDKLQNLVRSELIAGSSSPQLGLEEADLDGTDADILLDYTYSKILGIHYQDSPYTPVKIVQISDLGAYRNDPFNKFSEEFPIAYEQAGHIYFQGWEGIKNLIVKYLKYTNTITDLSDHTHEEVCQIAARKVLATLGDPRYQILQAEITERRV
tara:strand:+ start:84 stop:698 length:615 start_codon:yes stop_codon:yes gene_type:complete